LLLWWWQSKINKMIPYLSTTMQLNKSLRNGQQWALVAICCFLIIFLCFLAMIVTKYFSVRHFFKLINIYYSKWWVTKIVMEFYATGKIMAWTKEKFLHGPTAALAEEKPWISYYNTPPSRKPWIMCYIALRAGSRHLDKENAADTIGHSSS